MEYSTIHVISFQVPYPPIYGGLIDVYYKLKALREDGWRVVLHTYRYGNASEEAALLEVADEVYYYHRNTGFSSICSLTPYIIYSRRDKTLLHRLMADDAPILFEGLHTCYFLTSPLLKHKKKYVRTHNIEHDYYSGLSKASRSWIRKLYYTMEAWKLKRFEKILSHADALLAISQSDAVALQGRYPQVPVEYLPCFYNNKKINASLYSHPIMNKVMLYHGNLSVEENIVVAKEIIALAQSSDFPHDLHLYIAGYHPADTLKRATLNASHVTLIENPSEEEMEQLVRGAHIHLLLTHQATGVKLKLLHALTRGNGHVLVNSNMLPEEAFREFCHVADTRSDLMNEIRRLSSASLSQADIDLRIEKLKMLGYQNRLPSLLRK